MLILTHPLWLWALAAAVAVPGAAHWLARGPGRRMVFPAARFLQAMDAGRSRWRRWRDRLLLLLRVLSLTLIVLAFARPVWSWTHPAARGHGQDVLLVVDRSASMRRATGGVRLFDRAKAAAQHALGRLTPGTDRAVVVMADAHPTPVLPEATANFSALSKRLAQQTASYQPGRLGQAMRLGRSLLRSGERGKARPLRVELFTDGQATTWPGRTIARWRAAGAAMRVHRFLAATGNLALAGVTVEPSVTSAGQPVRVTATIANHSNAAASATATVTVQGDRVSPLPARTVQIKPGRQATVHWLVAFAKTGLRPVTVHVAGAEDALRCDDAGGALVRVQSGPRVWLVTAADVSNPRSGAYFVDRALAAGGRRAAVRVVQPGALAAEQRADIKKAGNRQSPASSLQSSRQAVWIICETGRMIHAALTAVAQHLRRGGGVWWIADDAAAGANLTALSRVAAGPGKVQSPIEPAAGSGWVTGRNLKLGSGDFEAAVLSVFDGAARSALLRTRFSTGLIGQAASGARVWLRFADGGPALAMGRVGPGKLAVLAGDIRPVSSELVKGPVFLPLVRQVVAAIGSERLPTRVVRPGQVLEMPIAAGQHVIGPSGLVLHGQAIIAHEPGWYRLLSRRGRTVDAVWAGVDPRESNLTPAFPDKETGRQGGKETTMRGVAGPHVQLASGGERGVMLWPYLMLAAVAGLGLEAWLVGPAPRNGPRKGGHDG